MNTAPFEFLSRLVYQRPPPFEKDLDDLVARQNHRLRGKCPVGVRSLKGTGSMLPRACSHLSRSMRVALWGGSLRRSKAVNGGVYLGGERRASAVVLRSVGQTHLPPLPSERMRPGVLKAEAHTAPGVPLPRAHAYNRGTLFAQARSYLTDLDP
jgi:hypothetical protein